MNSALTEYHVIHKMGHGPGKTGTTMRNIQ